MIDYVERDVSFQYSLRIVGFRDLGGWGLKIPLEIVLSVFPANRGVPRQKMVIVYFMSTIPFQYSLRIVGFRDLSSGAYMLNQIILSVFPANRGVPRRGTSVRVHYPSYGFQYSLRIVGFRDLQPCC